MVKSSSLVQKFTIKGSQENLRGYLHLMINKEGNLEGIHLDIHKEGTFGRAMAHSFTTAFNACLKHGIPLRHLIDEFKDWKFPPEGVVDGSPNVKHCSSLMDYLAKELECMFLTDRGFHE